MGDSWCPTHMGIDSGARGVHKISMTYLFACRLEENIAYELSCLTFGEEETDQSSDEMPSLDRLAIGGK